MVRYDRLVVESGVHATQNKHFCRDWLHSSSGAISSYLWEISLIVSSPGHRTQFIFQKYPVWGLR